MKLCGVVSRSSALDPFSGTPTVWLRDSAREPHFLSILVAWPRQHGGSSFSACGAKHQSFRAKCSLYVTLRKKPAASESFMALPKDYNKNTSSRLRRERRTRRNERKYGEEEKCFAGYAQLMRPPPNRCRSGRDGDTGSRASHCLRFFTQGRSSHQRARTHHCTFCRHCGRFCSSRRRRRWLCLKYRQKLL